MTLLVTTSSFGLQDDAPLRMLERFDSHVVLNPMGRKLNEDETLTLFATHDPIGVVAGIEILDLDILSAAPSLRAIARCGIGMDTVDLEAAERLGISVTNTPDAPTEAVVELALGLMFNLLRSIPLCDRSIRQEGWKRPMGRLLSRMTVGIVGCGRVGSGLAAILTALGTTVLGCDPAGSGTECILQCGLDELLERSDLVSLHLPLTSATRNIINRDTLAAMKPGAYLLNTARGGLVDEDALHRSLVSGHLAGAALDCFGREPYTGPLAELDNVIMTPHIGSFTRETRVRMETEAAENLLRQLGDA